MHLFRAQASDPVVPKLYTSTEEGKKVCAYWKFLFEYDSVIRVAVWQVVRNMEAGKNHGDGDVRLAVYRRVADPLGE
jgi:hypothetical protein